MLTGSAASQRLSHQPSWNCPKVYFVRSIDNSLTRLTAFAIATTGQRTRRVAAQRTGWHFPSVGAGRATIVCFLTCLFLARFSVPAART